MEERVGAKVTVTEYRILREEQPLGSNTVATRPLSLLLVCFATLQWLWLVRRRCPNEFRQLTTYPDSDSKMSTGSAPCIHIPQE